MNINSTTTTTTTPITDRSSITNNQEPEGTHGRIICAIPPEEIESLLKEQEAREEEKIQALKETHKLLNEERVQLMKKNLLPQYEWGLVLPYLHYNDIISTARCFESAKREMDGNKNLMYNARFFMLTTQEQAAFKRFKEKMSETGIYRWMCQFSAEEQKKNHSMGRLLFTRSLAMRNCPIFQIEEQGIIAHHTNIQSATFSADSLHLMTVNYNNTATIYGQDSSGVWILKIIIDHSPDEIKAAIFSADDSHVITISGQITAKIHTQDSNGQWMQQTTIQYPAAEHIHSATFSADSTHAMIISNTFTQGAVALIGKNSNGTWTQKALIREHPGSIGTTSAMFSPDSRTVFIIAHNKTTEIYEYDSSGDTWTKKDTPELNKPALFAAFSEDSRHIMINRKNRNIGIYRQDLDGTWTKKILIKKNASRFASNISPIFSNDSRCVMIIRKCHKAAKIYGRNSDGEWTKKATIKHKHYAYAQSRSFSPDSRHAVTSFYNGTVKIYSKMADDQWIKTATYRHGGGLSHNNKITTIFNADSNQMLVAFTRHKAIKIYIWTSDEKWIESHVTDIDADQSFQAATFSADGSHVIIVATNTVKIYELKTKDNTWKEKAHIDHTGVETASISAYGDHVVTVSRASSTAKIWRLSLE